ncbi:hypothetical protein HYFRA_00008928 [Hymenoscyphus fraxineus]|uniref:Uncharacterized protein n=1 Tax=Hymenoscyphus fraxineus TaxID=746836 RepID=A0A9N9PMS7_9HELO|nr:hypothetical protein HYFRA_00008928 [Hymenoscyphus fraxineus]
MATWGSYFASYVKKKDPVDTTEKVEEKTVETPSPIKVNSGVTRPNTTTKKLYGSTIELTEEKRVDATQPIGSNAGRMAKMFGYEKPATTMSMSQVVNDAIQKSKIEAQAGPKVEETVTPLPTLITSMPQRKPSIISAVSPRAKPDFQSTILPAVDMSPLPRIEPQATAFPGFIRRKLFTPKTSVSLDTNQADQINNNSTITGTSLTESPLEMRSTGFRSSNQSLSSVSNLDDVMKSLQETKAEPLRMRLSKERAAKNSLDSLMADLQSTPVEPAPRRRGTKQSVSLAATQNSLDDIMAALQGPVISVQKRGSRPSVASQLSAVTSPESPAVQKKAITDVIRDRQSSTSAASIDNSVTDEEESEEFVESRAWAHARSMSQFKMQQDLMEEERLRMEEEQLKFQQQEKQFAEEQEQQRLFLEEVRRAQEQEELEEAERVRIAQEEADRLAEEERIKREIDEERIAKEAKLLAEVNEKEAQEKKRLADEARKREQEEMQREVQRLIKEEEDRIRREEGGLPSPVDKILSNKAGNDSEIENNDDDESQYSDELVESEDEEDEEERLAAERREYEAEMEAARLRDEKINAEKTEKQRQRAEKEKAYELQYQREAEEERIRLEKGQRGGGDVDEEEDEALLYQEEEQKQYRRVALDPGSKPNQIADEEAQRLLYEEEIERLRLDEIDEQRRRNDEIKQERIRFKREEEERERYVQQEAERARYEAEQREQEERERYVQQEAARARYEAEQREEAELQKIAARLQAEDEAAEKEAELRKAEEKIRAAFSGLAKERGEPAPILPEPKQSGGFFGGRSSGRRSRGAPNVPPSASPINRAPPARSNTAGFPPPQAREIPGGLVRGNTVGGGSGRRNDAQRPPPPRPTRGNGNSQDRNDGGRYEPPPSLLRGNTVGGRQPPTQAPPRPIARGNTVAGRPPPRGLPSGPRAGAGLPSGPRPRRT